MVAAVVLNRLAAFRRDSSLLPTTSCASKVWTDCIGGGLVTVVAVSALGGRFGISGPSLSDSFTETDDSKSSSKFLASVISPRAMLSGIS